MGLWSRRRGQQIAVLTLILAALILSGALVAYAESAAVVPDSGSPPLRFQASPPPQGRLSNAIANGDFERGFQNGVAFGWGAFQNGSVTAGWYDDTWDKVVFEGKHAQLLELKNAQQLDRYVGIFQTVSVAPDADYILTLHGLVRSDSGSNEASNFGFRMQYGIDYRGGTNWEDSQIQWIELPWDEQPRKEPTRMDSYTATIRTKSPQLTLFIRGWKKWADGVEGNYDIDGVSLVGPYPPGGPHRPDGKPGPGGPQGPGEPPGHGGPQPPGNQPPPGTQPPPGYPATATAVPGGQPTATVAPAMPVTGNAFAVLENPAVVVPSIALLVVLLGGAAWGLTRNRP